MSTPNRISARTLLVLVSYALVLVGCAMEVAPIEVAAGCPERPVRGPSQYAAEPEQQLIDDFEHEGGSLPRLGGRDGRWILGSDSSGDELEADISEQCAGRGQRAGHFVGNGFSSWGANWTPVLRSSSSLTAVPYDATPYGGISFWAALSSEAPQAYSLPVGVSTIDVAWNGGVCETCMDIYRTTVALDRTWRRFEIRFSDLAQSGVGDPLVTLRREELVGFVLWPKEDFDFWIDDVRFEQ
jgi:hypothetical protein